MVILMYFILVVVCSRSLSGSALLSRSRRSLVGGDVIELTLCNIWYSASSVCVCGVCGLSFLSFTLSNMVDKCGSESRSFGADSNHNWSYWDFTLVIRVTK